MKHITAYLMLGFNAQLRKEAGVTQFVKGLMNSPGAKRRVLGNVLSWTGKGLESPGVGRQMVGGGAAGAAGGALMAGEGNRLEGALAGGALGAGAVGGRFLASKPGREVMKNFGRRQRYYATGQGVDRAKAREIGVLRKAPKKDEFVPSGMTGVEKKKYLAKAEKSHAKEMGRHKLHEEAFDKGYLSLPGIAEGLTSGRAKDVIKSGWKRHGMLDKAFLGLGGVETGRALATKSEPDGPGRAQRALQAVGRTAGWLVAPHAMLPGTVAAAGLGTAGKNVGKAVDYGVGKVKPKAPSTQPALDY